MSSMTTADDIAHCALMIDQARDLLERGEIEKARERALSALDHARAAQTHTDVGHARQVQECCTAADRLLARIDERGSPARGSPAQPRK